jgi:hypothetical protein
MITVILMNHSLGEEWEFIILNKWGEENYGSINFDNIYFGAHWSSISQNY